MAERRRPGSAVPRLASVPSSADAGPVGAYPAALPDVPVIGIVAPSAHGSLVPHPVPGQTGPRGTPDPARTNEFDQPSSARVYDYLLGGSTHGAVDRRCAQTLLRHEPQVGHMARAARAFLRRAVRFLLDAGIDQFVDLGSGMPTMGNVHEVVARAGGNASVAYVERDATAVSSGRRLLHDHPRAVYVDADIRDVDAVLDHPHLRRVVDPARPVGLLAFAVLQQISDADDPAGLIAAYLSRLAPGSALAVSHLSTEDGVMSTDEVAGLTSDYAFSSVRPRDRPAIARMVRGVDLVEPGLTFASHWRPDLRRTTLRPYDCGHLAGVGFRR